MKSPTFLAILLLLAPTSGYPAEIKGSLFLSGLGGALTVKVSLAKVYLLDEHQANAVVNTNRKSLADHIQAENLKRIDAYNKAVAEYAENHQRLISTIDFGKKELDSLAAKIEFFQSNPAAYEQTQTSGSATRWVAEFRSKQAAQNSLVDQLEALQKNSKPKDLVKFAATKNLVINTMVSALTEMQHSVRTDADGFFSVNAKNEHKYLMIIPQDNGVSVRWFLRVEKLKKDGDKYLFSNPNSAGSDEVADALEIKMGDPIKVSLRGA